MNLKHRLPQILLIASIFSSTFFSACEQDDPEIHPCQTFNYGQIPIMPLPNEPFPFHNGEALIFKDSLGHELRMEMNADGIRNSWTLNTTETSASSSCNGGTRFISNEQSFSTTFHSDSSNFELYCSFQANMSISNDTAYFYDGMYPSVREGDNPVLGWHVTISYIANARGNEAYFAERDFFHRYEFSDLRNFLGKDFSKVYSKYELDGSELHFNHELGFVAFRKEHGTLWVLDRTE
jgi:hypothetical protein